MALSLLHYLAAVIGHGATLIFLQNFVFALPLRRPVLKAIRKVNLPLILSNPIQLWLLFGGPLTFPTVALLWGGELGAAASVALAYLWVVGFLVAPALQVRYWLRRGAGPHAAPAQARTVNVVAELGYRPAGTGRHRRLVRLPRNEVFRVDFVERTFRLPRLPAAWDGLSVLHLTDLHYCGTPDRAFYQYVLDRCRDWEPDIVALTGDLVDSDKHHRWVIPTLGRLRWRLGAFAVLGNHDSWYDPALSRRRLRRLGMHVLGNSWARLDVEGRPLTVVGHEGPWFGPPPDLSACPPDDFRLCLSHTPDNLGWCRRNGVDLMLSGHNHGGQIRFPLVGSVFVPSLYGRAYDCGTFWRPPTLLHVGRGLAGKQPVRYGCRPEVSLIVLRSAAPRPAAGAVVRAVESVPAPAPRPESHVP